MSTVLPAWFIEQNPPSATVKRLIANGRKEAAREQYRIELVAAMMGISPRQYRKEYGGSIEEERRETGEAVVYFIGRSGSPNDGEPIKIGIARDVTKRMRSLQSGSPEDLYLLATIEGGKQREGEIHRTFHDEHIRGEWFRMSPAIRAYVGKHRRDPDLDGELW